MASPISSVDAPGDAGRLSSALVISAAMMLEFLGEGEAASRITKALESLPASPGASTEEIGDAIAERV